MVYAVKNMIKMDNLFIKQSELTNYIRKKKNIKSSKLQNDICAIICELWETANELKSEGFKYWTDKKRTGKTLEETVDILHFYLQIGNDLNVVTEHHHIEKRKSIMDQVMAINTSLLMIDGPLMWTLSFAQYRGLVEMLGFNWENDIIPAYNEKYEENIARQDRGY